LTGGKVVDSGDVTVFDETAQILFEPAKFIKSGPGRLFGIASA
jgi:hypothetical protein